MEEAEEDGGERHIEFGTLAEQQDETFYDNRENACDDVEKGRLSFPRDKLYGRDKELAEFKAIMQDPQLQVVLLSGFSGSGKSSLVEEVVRTYPFVHSISGKFGQLKQGDPFLALSQALNQFLRRLKQMTSPEGLALLQKRLRKADIYHNSHDALVLMDTLMPDLAGLLLTESKTGEKSPSSSSNTTTTTTTTTAIEMHDLNVIKYAFNNFLKALATAECPVVLFMDDLQWAEDACLQLFMDICKQKSSKHILLIGAYRSNELNDDHPLLRLINDKSLCNEMAKIHNMELVNLSPDDVAQFIADSMDLTVSEIRPIAQAVYTKTLGNIFFVQQALEELVRQNIVYYDVMCFEWRFSAPAVEKLEQLLPDDVISMVLNKLNTLPLTLQTALTLAAYVHDTIHLPLLVELLNHHFDQQIQQQKNASGLERIDRASLQTLMNLAYVEGLVLHCYSTFDNNNDHQPIVGVDNDDESRAASGGNGVVFLHSDHLYKFSHDRIREAACALIPAGETRNQVIMGISQFLLKRGESSGNDWMLFTAARHLNSLPVLPADLDLVQLNLTVGKSAVSKGTFAEAVVLFRAGAERLKKPSCWHEPGSYDQTLQLLNYLNEAEQALGNHDKVIETCQEIFQHAKCVPDKSRAQLCFIMSSNTKGNMNHSQTTDTTLAILQMYGISVPISPSKRQLEWEKTRLALALAGRSLVCLTQFPISTDPAIVAPFRIASISIMFSLMSGRAVLSNMIGYRILRYAVEKRVVTVSLPFTLSTLGEGLRRNESYRQAMTLANVGAGIMNRLPDNRELDFLKGKLAVSNLQCLRSPAREMIDPYMELHKRFFAKGDPMFTSSSAMTVVMSYLVASIRLTSAIESKLILFEERAKRLGSKTFAVILCMLRQTIYNLQGGTKASPNPVDLNGAACSEEKIQADLEGDARRMNMREIGSFRLMLAVIFDNEAVMAEMLDLLDQFPVYEIPAMRQHIRMMYIGFGALILSHKSLKHKKWAKIAVKFYKKLAQFGSANAQLVCICMQALAKPSVARFDEAIQLCGNDGLINLAALMNERCGLMLLEKSKEGGQTSSKDNKKGEEYLKCAIWLYKDWGATGKVEQLQSRYECLRSFMSEKAPMQLSALRYQAAQFAASMSRTTDQMSEMRSGISG